MRVHALNEKALFSCVCKLSLFARPNLFLTHLENKLSEKTWNHTWSSFLRASDLGVLRRPCGSFSVMSQSKNFMSHALAASVGCTDSRINRLFREYLSLAHCTKRPLHFFNACLRGFRFLKHPKAASEIFDVIKREEGLAPDYETYREYISVLLESQRFQSAIIVFQEMISAGWEIHTDLVNIYVQGFSASVNGTYNLVMEYCVGEHRVPSDQICCSAPGDHHQRAWDMYTQQTMLGKSLSAETYVSMFDSCVQNAHLPKILIVGRHMEVSVCATTLLSDRVLFCCSCLDVLLTCMLPGKVCAVRIETP